MGCSDLSLDDCDTSSGGEHAIKIFMNILHGDDNGKHILNE